MSANPAWSGALAVVTGALCYTGRLSDAQRHHHVATQVVRSWADPFELTDAHGRAAVTSAAVIPSGREHSIRILSPASGVIIFLDPSAFSRTGPDGDDVAQWVAAGDELPCWTTPLPPEQLLDELIGTPPSGYTRPTPDIWHPSLLAAVELVPRLLPEAVRLTDVAKQVGLSPGRLGRLFKLQLGQSFPTYVRWARLRCAVEAVRDGASLTDAAHAAGFTDSAHANRVCHEMFGLSPSAASRELVWS
ncbi:helix-turn-helix transcriptional regulator [Mycobacterium sp. TNTM28]|uniref:Helix-turn-helix transcriptional regulator n=1 Tax=[Mycobacterium] fortunisiensis TaxID=2600579 RepID=A0ABS6KMC5_9MYCO|nr:helix-turn-helix transcriptional regulator [[Mycobacterium] fortunisiensis]MBU9764717.1 helix-turn-helix transcriptional regulator [[Mycobacterium] fortunisiensis]